MRYEVATATDNAIENGPKEVWNDAQGTYFTNLTNYLIGSNYFQMPKILTEGDLSMNITIYRPSTIYVTFNDEDHGGFRESLPNEGWIEQVNEEIETNHVSLNRIFMKNFTKNGRTSITLPRLTSNFKGVVFIRGDQH